jgi:hypothetical protein
MKKVKRLFDRSVMPISFVLLTLSAIYTEPSKSDQILLVVFAGAFWIIDIILSKNEKQKN